MSSKQRSEFSRFGFIMAAAGSAVGLGNIWSFPSQVTQNGGAVFVLAYIILTVAIAYPALLVELSAGRHTQTNAADTFRKIDGAKRWIGVGYLGLICSAMILSFYSIVGGWMITYFCKSLFTLVGLETWANAIQQRVIIYDLTFTSLFYLLTILIITAGLKKGIETWSKILMPMLIILLVGLIAYVLTLDGAMIGLKKYLCPDFSKLLDFDLILNAMGQAFFSASLGGGAMLIYGSYLSKKQNLQKVGASVLVFDFSIAFLAGLLIMPAMYAASAKGISIFDEQGKLIEGGGVVFQVLPALFGSMGKVGHLVLAAFFLLMIIAALTSSISMLEGVVAYAVDNQYMNRKKASWVVGLMLWLVSVLLIVKFELLFGLFTKITMQVLIPGINIGLCILMGWILKRSKLIEEFRSGANLSEDALVLKILPIFFKYIIPIAVTFIWIRSFK